MITYEQAREAVIARLGGDTDLVVDSHGYSDSRDYFVLVRVADPAILVLGGPIYLVDRVTGTVHEEAYIADLARYDAMTSTGGLMFEAGGPAGSISWHERAPHLFGEATLVEAVEAVLRAAGPTIAVTPTGPFAPATPSNGEAVFAALLHLGGFEFAGDVPTFPIPFGAVA